jgi:acyl transferase domain-containing protein/thioester reductase-like protein/SAM-dependent methyltransferase/acyl carrier protein
VTTSEKTASPLIQKLKSAGLHVTQVALRGRFHWQKHQKLAQQLIQFCNLHQKFQFPETSKLQFSTRSALGGQYITTGDLHVLALRAVLLEQAQWYKTVSVIYSSQFSSNDSSVVCFGSERCMPPSIARKLGSRLIHVSEIDLKTSPQPSQIFGNSKIKDLNDLPDDRIAVIGMAAQVPGAEDIQEFWNVLIAGKSQHREIPTERFEMETAWREVDPNRKWYGNFIEAYDAFDHKFFKKSPREMASTDPQHRLMLQIAYQAVEQSGYFASDFDKHIGCFMGIGNGDYESNIACHPANAYSATGNLKSFLAGKISHYFGWTGPSLTLDTACSSSSVAIHQACRAILNGECVTALAGGVNMLTSPDWYHNLAGASFLSTTGQCKPFDIKGDGYCRGEGVAAVYLKKLSSAIADGDHVYGVIAATKVYQNQNCTAITVPNAISLSQLFGDVVKQARLEPRDVSVVEAHGTGTAVGDPAEYDGIRKVFGGPDRPNVLALSSVKGLVGHTESASGVVSLIKTLLMIQEGVIPPQASFTTINPSLNAVPEDKINIFTSSQPWNVDFRAALINNYGASGSNASMVVTEAPGFYSPRSGSPSAKKYPFWFAGSEESHIRAYIAKLKGYLQQKIASRTEPALGDLSYQVSRQSNRSFQRALIVDAISCSDLLEKLNRNLATVQIPSTRPVILTFGGQISTYVGLDREIYEGITTIRNYLDQCDAMCISFGLGSIFPSIFQRSPIDNILQLQLALFSTQYSCAMSWIDSGVKVAAVVGHSFGELTALCVSGGLSVKDAIIMVAGRSQLIQNSWGAEKGSMIAVEGDLADVTALLNKAKAAISESISGNKLEPSIACYNGPRSFTLAGTVKAMNHIKNLADMDATFSGLKLKVLNVTNAFHSDLVNPLVNDLETLGKTLTFRRPYIRLERSTELKSTSESLSSQFVANHMRQPVFFNHAVQRLASDFPEAIWLEAGSNSTITNMARRALGQPTSSLFQPINITTDGSFDLLVDSTMKLWKEGLNVSFWGHHPVQKSDHNPIILPPYQFEKSRHWMELKKPVQPTTPVVQEPPVPDLPMGLTTLVESRDTRDLSLRFRVNTDNEKFVHLVSSHVLVGTAAVCPGMFQLEIVLDALMGLRPELQNLNYVPETQTIKYFNPLVVEQSKTIWLDADARDAEGLIWDWKLTATGTTSRGTTQYTTGTILFRRANDIQVKNDFERLERMAGRKRYLRLLESNDAEELLTGRNIYRAFSEVVNYKEAYRFVTRIVGGEDLSAGRVVKSHEKETWLDSVLTDCFCQVAGIFVNLMTEKTELTETGIFVCDKIDRWMRASKINSKELSLSSWEVFAIHDKKSDTNYVSDVFAFDSSDGSLIEVVSGINYQWVPLDGIRKALSRLSPTSEPQLPRVQAPVVPAKIEAFAAAPNPVFTPLTQTNGVAKKKAIKKTVKTQGPDISKMTREILCNLSGLEADEIRDDSDLVELGIDSLMGMELAREVQTAFKCTLDNSQLMDLTDFQSLVMCIRSTLGIDDETTDDELDELETPTEEHIPAVNGTTPHMNGTNGINGVNGDSHSSHSAEKSLLPASLVLDVFREAKEATDSFIAKGDFAMYHDKVMPRSTALCIAHIVNAFEELGCPIRSAAPGQKLERVPYVPKHEQFMNLIYDLMRDAGLIEINGSEITRTAVAAPPPEAVDTLFEELLRDEPIHAAEHKLTALIGPKFADCLLEKEDGLNLIFGTPEGREVVSEMYAKSPINLVWIEQAKYFFEQLVSRLPAGNEPLRILEMGAGTGGTTSNIVPLLARLNVPVVYTVTDISSSLVAAARKRFKNYPFMEFKLVNIEATPDPKLLHSQHIVLATNCVHATRDLSVSTRNIHQLLRPDGFLLMLEMTVQVPWVEFTFGLIEGWWLFEDGRKHALSPATYWEKVLRSVGYGHVDWTEGKRPESEIQRLIIAHASDPRYDKREPGASLSLSSSPALIDSLGRQSDIDRYVREYTKSYNVELVTKPASDLTSIAQCVLVTGATGSLGAHIVAYLTQRRLDIDSVICLNRPSTTEANIRQRQSFESKGIFFDQSSLSKVQVLEADTSKPLLGLPKETYQVLVNKVTHVIHNAWPMSLTRTIHAYETQFKVMRNLIQLATQATANRPSAFRFGFQFISSIGVVGTHPVLTKRPLVPEEAMTARSILPVGYSEAKLVCERMLDETLNCHPHRFRAMTVRIAQISGSTTTGYWNPVEHFAFLIKSSQRLKVLPDLKGSLSWCPVDDVAVTLGEMLVSDTDPYPIYHIENPSRQPWAEMTVMLAHALDIPLNQIVPFNEWVDRVRNHDGPIAENPAKNLVNFFDEHFIRMSCGGLILDTVKTREHSETLRKRAAVSRELVSKYITAWKKTGFLS